jgi:small GTP-binding protein
MLIPTASPEFKSGFVALVGRPNVGKSTLMNALIGQKIAIISPIAQTTRNRLKGILTLDRAQIILVDTPGIHKPHHLLGEVIVGNAMRAIEMVDLVIWLVDSNVKLGKGDRFIAELIQKAGTPVLLGLNKIDQLTSAAPEQEHSADTLEQSKPDDPGEADDRGSEPNRSHNSDHHAENVGNAKNSLASDDAKNINSKNIDSPHHSDKFRNLDSVNRLARVKKVDRPLLANQVGNQAKLENQQNSKKTEHIKEPDNSDLEPAPPVDLDLLEQSETCRSYLDYAETLGWEAVKFSALTQQGLDHLQETICDRLTPGPYYSIIRSTRTIWAS